MACRAEAPPSLPIQLQLILCLTASQHTHQVACSSVHTLVGFIGEIQAVSIWVGSLSKVDLLIQDVAPMQALLVLCQLCLLQFFEGEVPGYIILHYILFSKFL